MCIKPFKRICGYTLIELMVAVAVFSIGAAALGSTFLFSIRSMAALSNYTALDHMNQQAMDQITREIREAKMIVDYSTNALVLDGVATGHTWLQIVNGDGNTVWYIFSGSAERLYKFTQRADDSYASEVLLEDCSLLNFQIGQRNLQSNSWNYFPPTLGDFQNTAKVIDLSWKTSRTLPHGLVNSEDIQTAKIVLRHK